MATAAGDRATQIRAVLAAVAELSRTIAAPRTTPFADTTLTRTQLEILFVLAHTPGSVAPSELAAQLKVTAGAITQTVEQLQQHGLVTQVTSGHDARRRDIQLTDEARQQVEAFEEQAAFRARQRFDALADGELAQLAALLGRVGRAT